MPVANGSTAASLSTLPFNVLAELEDGQLAVLFSWPTGSTGNNDFYFASGRLTADGTRAEAPPVSDVPVAEPAVLGLFAFGLAGVLRRRWRMSKS
jgi:MYXO-CTERM domain-containing protein